MVPIRFISLVLGLLFTLLAVRDSIAHTHQTMEKMVVAEGNGFAASGKNTVSVEKELFNGVAAAAAAENKRLRGRKMVVNNVLRKEEDLNRGTSKISGQDNNASKNSLGTSQENMTDQNNGNMIEPTQTLNSASMEIFASQDSKAISTSESLECSSKSKKSVSQESHNHFQKSESQKLLAAANEIVNLMHKDYLGMDKPRRAPPINNHQPLDEENLQP